MQSVYDIVKISQIQYSCVKRNYKPCLMIYILIKETVGICLQTRKKWLSASEAVLCCAVSLKCWSVTVLMFCMCLCAAGRHRHTWHPRATCGMHLRENLVCCGTLINEMVFFEVILKYLCTVCGKTQVLMHYKVASVPIVHSFGFWHRVVL